MKADPQNPPANNIPAGITESHLITAIAASGYPLQGIIAARLLPTFDVFEEWGFIDDGNNEHRSLDIHAFASLDDRSNARRHTGINLLIECKRSQHPFVFFQQVVRRGAPRFPHVDGIPHRFVSIHEGKTGRLIEAPPALALGLDVLPFVASGPPICASFSKAVPSGKRVELSGTDPFNTVVLPLIKAFRHATGRRQLPKYTDPIYPTLTLCIAVLDAPMLVVESPGAAETPVLRPWVRVVRHESTKDVHNRGGALFYTIDVVHAEYLETFLAKHLMPFSEVFAERAASCEDVLRYGGTVADLANWTWDTIKPRHKPSP